jgi:hypothetical protein
LNKFYSEVQRQTLTKRLLEIKKQIILKIVYYLLNQIIKTNSSFTFNKFQSYKKIFCFVFILSIKNCELKKKGKEKFQSEIIRF